MEASKVTGLLFDQLSFRNDRQNVISSNIANINTPNYKTKDLVFEDELQKANNSNDLSLTTTSSMHIAGSNDSLKQQEKSKLIELKGLEEQNDGNNVNLDSQMSEMSKNKVIFDALQSSIKKDSTWFKSVIESSAKN
ncbi:flagellar basal body rod protein FlgB [Halarcobacter ebronensis]|uniref:Flagellar basal body rod protein FlgB n=1 Tax=Halarcobacter ebronensis TaxID=1462615 RepID=A0A4Q1AMK6_9BACT|nr:flagellar basal body rod protein FlgB [Halarcobacter ebronensis]QKF82911.1 flagellar proximal rod protein FlgB [Halarcobacter ebronensis]RXK06927.1 flagellar basal body rod protein FlgB [Halarcobacter ebronensis]